MSDPKDTQILPPPFEEDFSDKTDRDILLALVQDLRVVRSELASFKNDVNARLAEGIRRFELQDADIGLAMNAIKVSLVAKGHEEAATKMQEAIDVWASQRQAAGFRDEPTNPGDG